MGRGRTIGNNITLLDHKGMYGVQVLQGLMFEPVVGRPQTRSLYRYKDGL